MHLRLLSPLTQARAAISPTDILPAPGRRPIKMEILEFCNTVCAGRGHLLRLQEGSASTAGAEEVIFTSSVRSRYHEY